MPKIQIRHLTKKYTHTWKVEHSNANLQNNYSKRHEVAGTCRDSYHQAPSCNIGCH